MVFDMAGAATADLHMPQCGVVVRAWKGYVEWACVFMLRCSILVGCMLTVHAYMLTGSVLCCGVVVGFRVVYVNGLLLQL